VEWRQKEWTQREGKNENRWEKDHEAYHKLPSIYVRRKRRNFCNILENIFASLAFFIQQRHRSRRREKSLSQTSKC
jgi:hypothetical protein